MSRVVGARTLRRKLQRIDPEVTKGVRQALQDGVERIQQSAVALVPRRTGNLARILGERRAIGRKSGGFKTEFGFRTKRQRRDGWYAHFVEFGTKGSQASGILGRRRRGSKRSVAPRAAQPFLRPALELNRQFIRKRRDREIAQALERAAHGFGGRGRRAALGRRR